MVYTVTFNAAIDYVVHTKDVSLGSTNRSDREEMYLNMKDEPSIKKLFESIGF